MGRKLLERMLQVLLVMLVLVLVAALTWMRTGGGVVMAPDGRMIGWSESTGEWLLLDYPTGPRRRDGPYVLRDGDRRVALDLVPGDGGTATVVRTPVRDRVRVVVDADRPAQRITFDVPLHGARGYARAPVVVTTMPDRLLAVSDVEGDFPAFVRLLRGNGVIDADLHWRWGDGHLLLVGDMVDRGRNVVPLLWLVYRLEAEARAAGGAVHYLLGNHEQYVLQGRPKYVAPKYYGTMQATGLTHAALWSADSELGRWLRTRPVMMRIGDTLFVHGGISPLALRTGYGIEAIDALAARYMDVRRGDTGLRDAVVLLHKSGGLLKYRGLATASGKRPRAGASHVQRALAHFGAERIVIGHTLAKHVGHEYGGRVIRIDVDHAGGVNEGVLFDHGMPWRVDGRGVRSPLAEAAAIRR